MKLPNRSKVKKIVDSWEEAIWKQLYKGEASLDGQLAIISRELDLTSMPFLKNDSEKFNYLMKLEDTYYDKVFHECHDY